MKAVTLILLALLMVACTSPVGGEQNEPVGSVEQAFCYGPAGYHASGLVLVPATVQRAHFLVNKMWGSWPKKGACVGGGCVTMPDTCTQGQCDAGLCPGWSCRMTEIYYAADGLRMSTPVAGLSEIESQWTAQPAAGGLTGLETTELGVARATSVLLTDFWCGGPG